MDERLTVRLGAEESQKLERIQQEIFKEKGVEIGKSEIIRMLIRYFFDRLQEEAENDKRRNV